MTDTKHTHTQPQAPGAKQTPDAPGDAADRPSRQRPPDEKSKRHVAKPSRPEPNERGAGRGRQAKADAFQQAGRDEGGLDTRPRGATAALIELDRDLMRLLVRRATLVSRIRGGKEHASTPAAIQAEKAVRVAWEAGALAFSKDPRFTRQLFTLLQDLKVLTKEQAHSAGSFNLHPPAKPVAGSLAGPSSTRAAQMRVALAACLGLALDMRGLMLSSALEDTVKAFAQAGAPVRYEPHGAALARVHVEAGNSLSPPDKGLFAGDDLFTLYLLALLFINRPGAFRLTGGARLKAADLTPLRRVLPFFGARLAHVIPRSQGAPVMVECSGDIPPLVVVPAELPFEGLCALLLAPLAWGVPVTLNLAELPAGVATAALAEVRPLHREAGADVETHGPHLVYTPGPLAPLAEPALPLDPALAAYLLALPAFAGGSLSLKGFWPGHMPEAQEAEQLLAWAGLELAHTGDAVSTKAAAAPFSLPLPSGELSGNLGPLLLALAARCLLLTGASPFPPGAAPYPQDDTDHALAQEFFARLGFLYANGELAPGAAGEEQSAPLAWTSPDGYWSMAYALCAYIRPGLLLANPGLVTELMPPFWSIYNSLPEPADPAAPRRNTVREQPDDKPVRRRIIAE